LNWRGWEKKRNPRILKLAKVIEIEISQEINKGFVKEGRKKGLPKEP